MYLFVDFLTPLEVQHIQFKEVWELRRIKVYMCRSLLKTLLSYLFVCFFVEFTFTGFHEITIVMFVLSLNLNTYRYSKCYHCAV